MRSKQQGIKEPMFTRISNGWELAKASYRILWLDKELLIFPLVAGVSCLLVLASFALPLSESDIWASIKAMEEPGQEADLFSNPTALLITFAFYLCNYFVITFFNSAMVACAVIRLSGGDPTVGDGFRAAFARLPFILGWSLVAATVGLILNAIESRSERIGRLLIGLVGMAWSAATYFVVPILVVEGIGPFSAIRRSVAILRETWGEAIVANFGLGLIVLALMIVAALPAIAGAMMGGVWMFWLMGISLLIMILVALASSAAKAIQIAALYDYAAKGVSSDLIDADLLRRAFISKSR